MVPKTIWKTHVCRRMYVYASPSSFILEIYIVKSVEQIPFIQSLNLWIQSDLYFNLLNILNITVYLVIQLYYLLDISIINFNLIFKKALHIKWIVNHELNNVNMNFYSCNVEWPKLYTLDQTDPRMWQSLGSLLPNNNISFF